MIAGANAVLWVRQDGQGNDACRFAEAEGGYLIDGSSTDADWNIMRYRIRAREDGTTRRVRLGSNSRIFIRRLPDDTWLLNDTPVPEVSGAKDIYLDFTPATLTLPIRRLGLEVGGEAEVLVAHLQPGGTRMAPLHLVFRRVGQDVYDCTEAETGSLSRLKVDAQGIIRAVDGRWVAQK